MYKRILSEVKKGNPYYSAGGSNKEKVIDKFIEDNNLKISKDYYEFLVKVGWYRAGNDTFYGYTPDIDNKNNVVFNTNKLKEEIKNTSNAIELPENCYVIFEESENVSKYKNEKRYLFINEYGQLYLYNFKFIALIFHELNSIYYNNDVLSSNIFYAFEHYYKSEFENIATPDNYDKYYEMVERIRGYAESNWITHLKYVKTELETTINIAKGKKYDSEEERIQDKLLFIKTIIHIYIYNLVKVSQYTKKEVDSFIECMQQYGSIEYMASIDDKILANLIEDFVEEYKLIKKKSKNNKKLNKEEIDPQDYSKYKFTEKLIKDVNSTESFEEAKISSIKKSNKFNPNVYTEEDYNQIGISGHVLTADQIKNLEIDKMDYEYLYNIISDNPIVEIFNKYERDHSYDVKLAINKVLEAGYDLNKPILNNFRLGAINRHEFINESYPLVLLTDTMFLTQNKELLHLDYKDIADDLIENFCDGIGKEYNQINNRLAPILGITAINLNFREELLPIFIEHGADVNVRDSWNRTPFIGFFTNIFEGNYSDCEGDLRFLISSGAHVDSVMPEFLNSDYFYKNFNEVFAELNEENSSKILPKMYNHFGANINVVKLLLEHGISISDLDIDGCNLLSTSILPINKSEVKMDFIKELIKLGSDVNNTNVAGKPLLYRYIEDSPYPVVKVVELLVKSGADINGVYLDGKKTILDIAIEKNETSIISFLEKKKAVLFNSENIHLIRGTHYHYENFDNYITTHIDKVTEARNKLESKSYILDQERRLKENLVYDLVSIPYAMYSRGDNIEDIKNFYENYKSIIFENYNFLYYDINLRFISMLVLLDIEIPKNIIEDAVFNNSNNENEKNTDGLIYFLALHDDKSKKYLEREDSLLNVKRHELLKEFILSGDEKYALEYAKKYLRINRTASWNGKIGVEGFYFNGYWNTETAALIKILKINKEKFKDIAEFPFDLLN